MEALRDYSEQSLFVSLLSAEHYSRAWDPQHFMCCSGSRRSVNVCLHHQRPQIQSPLLPRLHCFWCGQSWHSGLAGSSDFYFVISQLFGFFHILLESGLRDHPDTRPGLWGGLPAGPASQEEWPRVVNTSGKLWYEAQQTCSQTPHQRPQISKHQYCTNTDWEKIHAGGSPNHLLKVNKMEKCPKSFAEYQFFYYLHPLLQIASKES